MSPKNVICNLIFVVNVSLHHYSCRIYYSKKLFLLTRNVNKAIGLKFSTRKECGEQKTFRLRLQKVEG